jgi:ComF family protein
VYEGHAKELLHAYKFGRRKYLKSFFGGLLAEFVRKNIPADSYDCVVALPLDRERVRERGFNQSALLAENLSGCLEAPYFADLVSRRRSAFAQSSLKKEQRKENVRGRFQLRSNHKNIYGKKVLLIDDILTTGQTASECAKIIKSGGARSVTVLAVARGV